MPTIDNYYRKGQEFSTKKTPSDSIVLTYPRKIMFNYNTPRNQKQFRQSPVGAEILR